jgi:hypothetical protein
MRRRQTEAVETLEEEAEPGRAAKLAVGDDLEADVLLPPDRRGDVRIKLRLVLRRRQARLLERPAGVLERAA